MPEKKIIPDVTMKFEVEVSFTSEWEKDEDGNLKVIFYQTIRCGDAVHTIKYVGEKVLFIYLLYEGWRRYEVANKSEEKLLEAMINLIGEASGAVSKEIFHKKGDYSWIDKIYYRELYNRVYEGEKGWKSAYKTFKRNKRLPLDKRIEATKAVYPNLPPHLIEKFGDQDEYLSTPAQIARQHIAEMIGLPTESEDYRRKALEGKKLKETTSMFEKAFSHIFPGEGWEKFMFDSEWLEKIKQSKQIE